MKSSKEIKKGSIYILADSWSPYDESILNHRPVIVLKKYEKYADIITLQVTFNFSNKESKAFIECFVGEKKYIANVSCDIIQKVPYEYFISEIGYVDGKMLDLIESKAYEKKEVTKNDIETIYHAIQITDKEKLDLLLQINNGVNKTIKLTQEPRKKINIFKDRTIGFILGIIASILSTVIWENGMNIINFLINVFK